MSQYMIYNRNMRIMAYEPEYIIHFDIDYGRVQVIARLIHEMTISVNDTLRTRADPPE